MRAVVRADIEDQRRPEWRRGHSCDGEVARSDSDHGVDGEDDGAVRSPAFPDPRAVARWLLLQATCDATPCAARSVGHAPPITSASLCAGSRRSILVETLAPPMGGIAGWSGFRARSCPARRVRHAVRRHRRNLGRAAVGVRAVPAERHRDPDGAECATAKKPAVLFLLFVEGCSQ